MHNVTGWGAAPPAFSPYPQNICHCQMEMAQTRLNGFFRKSPHELKPKHVAKVSQHKGPYANQPLLLFMRFQE